MLRRRFDRTTRAGLAGVCLAMVVSGCANVAQQGGQTAHGAPVAAPGAAPAAPAAASAASAPAAPAPEPLAAAPVALPRPEHFPPLTYRVRRGDTLDRIAQHHRCSVRELLAWNHLKVSARLRPGQVLHVASPATVREVRAAEARYAAALRAARAAQRAAASANGAASGRAQANGAPSPAGAPTGAAQVGAPPLGAAEVRHVDEELARHARRVALAWPAQGAVVAPFEPGQTRGIEIAGKAGDPVYAAADGRVMYAGTGLNEYGSLIIIQHDKDFLTAYSHNRKLLVKTGDFVRQGEQIAEMGSEDSTRVALLFELRHDGMPINPIPYLPPRRG